MAIDITEILETDEIASSRITINDNFTKLKDGVDALNSHVDPDTGDATVASLVIEKAATESLATVGLELQKSATVAGNLTVTGTTSVSSLTASSGVTASTGDITQTNSANKVNAYNLSSSGSVIQTGFSSAFTPAYDRDSYTTYSGTTGNLVTARKSVFLLRWTSAYDPANTADGYDIKDVRLPNTGDAGQRITICTKLDSNVTNLDGHFLLPPSGGTIVGVESGEGILLANNSSAVGSDMFYSSVELAWTGSEWLIISMHNAYIETV